MAGIVRRPITNGAQTVHQREARRLEIDFLDVEDFHAGLEHDRRRHAVVPEQRQHLARAVVAAERIVEDVELDLANALRLELLIERQMLIHEALEPVSYTHLTL